jgi:hypothetical protein
LKNQREEAEVYKAKPAVLIKDLVEAAVKIQLARNEEDMGIISDDQVPAFNLTQQAEVFASALSKNGGAPATGAGASNRNKSKGNAKSGKVSTSPKTKQNPKGTQDSSKSNKKGKGSGKGSPNGTGKGPTPTSQSSGTPPAAQRTPKGNKKWTRSKFWPRWKRTGDSPIAQWSSPEWQGDHRGDRNGDWQKRWRETKTPWK